MVKTEHARYCSDPRGKAQGAARRNPVAETRILVGIGANLASARYGPPLSTVEAALAALPRAGIAVTARSRWFESAPVPLADQPWYVNGIAIVASALAPRARPDHLHAIEAAFGRVR